jgi:hypothetical protein
MWEISASGWFYYKEILQNSRIIKWFCFLFGFNFDFNLKMRNKITFDTVKFGRY